MLEEKNKFFYYAGAFILIILVIINQAMALGITPGRTTIDFQPGLEKEIEFSVINNEQKDMRVLFRAEGELARYITLKAESSIVEFSASESEKKFAYAVKLPESLSGGSHS